MKKTYIIPEIKVIEMELTTLMAGSMRPDDPDMENDEVGWGGESDGNKTADSKNHIWDDDLW